VRITTRFATRIQYILIAVSLTILACSNGVQPDATLGRIVMYESVDGVALGEDTMSVIQKLGRPSSIGVGDFPGVVFEYHEGVHATMSVVIYNPSAIPSGVTSITVSSPYQGRTAEGVGLGMARDLVMATLGRPLTSFSADSCQHDRYTAGDDVFQISYRNGTAVSFNLSVSTGDGRPDSTLTWVAKFFSGGVQCDTSSHYIPPDIAQLLSQNSISVFNTMVEPYATCAACGCPAYAAMHYALIFTRDVARAELLGFQQKDPP
jgi:outer membrane protein assembly factor BamE (lipoprotein component of BamABCDE complex)